MIRFLLDRPARVLVELYQPNGGWVAQSFNGFLEAGRHTLPISTEDLPPGQYFCRLKADDSRASRKLLVLD
jgi:hypothetical protein